MSKVLEDTPLIKQFFAVKAQHPEAVLLYRVGDFYETYSDDALLASKVLGLVLTKRTNGDKGTLPMAGFPHHAIEGYLTKLVRAGYKVAVCDQLEDPKLAENKKLVKRGVTELITPGVTFNEGILQQKEHNYLVGVTFGKKEAGAAFLDVSTGSFRLAQGSESFIKSLMASLSPKEVLVTRGDEKLYRSVFGDGYYLSSMDEWAFVYDAAVEKLKKQFNVASLKGFAIDGCPLGICSAGALIAYLEQTQHVGLKNICTIGRIDEGKYVRMDKFTLRNLEIFDSAAGGEGVSLVSVIDSCVSPMGARLLRTWLAFPILDIKELEARYDAVSYLVGHQEDLETLRGYLGNVGDLERIVSRAATGKILPREVLQLSRGLEQLEPVRALCKDALKEMGESILGCGELLDDIRRSIAPDTAAIIGKGPVIAPGVNEDLDNLRDIASGGKDSLLKIQQRESEISGIPSLKVGYNNIFGYYLEVRNSYRDKVPGEWQRKQTLVNAERYITKELKEYEERILGAEEKIYALETRIYGELVSKIQSRIRDIQTNAGIIARLGTLAGFAAQALSHDYCRPVVTEGRELEIKAGRHPVIETLMKPGEEYVPNDISLDSSTRQIMILTGPNMAGKSALLRQTALIVLMAQIGSFVPAKEARIGWCDSIFTRVGATDNISRGESTFMVEMLETSMILHNLSGRSLVLLDEIGRGTSTYDGMSIARAIVEYIHEYGQGAKTLFATHYHELNDLEAQYSRVKNYHIAVKEVGKQVIFLRRLVEGGTEHSFGIHVARMAGMPAAVLESAEKTLAALEGSSKENYGHITKPYNIKEGRVESDGTLQLSLFQLDDPTLASLRDRLGSADLNNMTPLQAFDMLRDMKKELGL